MFQPRFAKHITKQKEWGSKSNKYQWAGGQYRTTLNKYQEEADDGLLESNKIYRQILDGLRASYRRDIRWFGVKSYQLDSLAEGLLQYFTEPFNPNEINWYDLCEEKGLV